MGQPKVSFTFGQGGSGRALPGFTHYSVMAAYYYASSANSAYANIGNKVYTSLQDAENDGVVNTYAEATASTAAQTVTTIGTNGDSVAITFTSFDGTIFTLGSYTKVSSDSTALLVATAIVASVNANTYITGFSATVGSTGAYTVTAPKWLGIYPNAKSLVNTLSPSATMAITNVAFASGTASPLAIFHYQISEFFRINPLGILYFSIRLDNSSNNVSVYNSQLQTDGVALASGFSGNGHQFLFYNPFRTFVTSTLDSLEALRATLLTLYTPAIMVYVGAYSGALSAQVNTRALTDDGVGACIAQSLSGIGYQLTQTQQAVICQGGTELGQHSLAAVSQSIGEVESFNVSDGVECELVGFYDGSNYTNISQGLGDQLYDFGYTFLRKFPNGVSGSFWAGGNCATNPESDYAYYEDCRTIDEAVRQVYVGIVKLLNSKNKVNSDGTLTTASITRYNEKASAGLEGMVRDEDLNDFSVSVDTTHVISSDGKVPITIGLQQEPIGRFIYITIGFKATL